MRRVDKRLANIEAQIEMLTKFAPIIVAIDKHIHYDELPKDEYKTLYCEYIGIDRETFEKVSAMVLGDLHVILRKIEPPSHNELQEIIAEVESMVLDEP